MRFLPFLAASTVAALSSSSSSRTLSTTTLEPNFSNNVNSHNKQQRDPTCPFYGCPKKPHDVHYNVDVVKNALLQIREMQRDEVDDSYLATLQQCCVGASDGVTLTLIGYKGGQLLDQINQDRALIVSPFFVADEQVNQYQTPQQQYAIDMERILVGVFDGHAPLGERVSEYTARNLPRILADKLRAALPKVKVSDESAVMQATSNVLSETFIELDNSVPGDPSGGCTATVVLQQGRKLYIANAGDSRSLIVTYRPSTQRSEIVYATREDKPSLPDEKARVEAAGGSVYIPIRGTSRVVYQDPQTGAPTGLAMSRSIGDWEAGKMGVIPDPIVHILDVPTLVQSELQDGSNNNNDMPLEDDVYIFAVCASDGLMDFLDESYVSKILAHSLFESRGVHPIAACEHLVFSAAQAWQQSKQGSYRDDISIAVTTLRRPPQTSADLQSKL